MYMLRTYIYICIHVIYVYITCMCIYIYMSIYVLDNVAHIYIYIDRNITYPSGVYYHLRSGTSIASGSRQALPEETPAESPPAAQVWKWVALEWF